MFLLVLIRAEIDSLRKFNYEYYLATLQLLTLWNHQTTQAVLLCSSEIKMIKLSEMNFNFFFTIP